MFGLQRFSILSGFRFPYKIHALVQADIIFQRQGLLLGKLDKVGQDQLFDRFADYLPTDGWLLIGHSETVPAANTRFIRSGKTAYRKVS